MISIENIKQVYSGKDGKCCCGCAGKHSTDQKQKTRIINILNKDPNTTKVEGCHAYTVVGSRLYIAYFQV